MTWSDPWATWEGSIMVIAGESLTVTLDGYTWNGGPASEQAFHMWAVPAIPGDADGNRIVNKADAAILAAHWGQSGDRSDGDFNGDGLIGPADASILAANWGYGTSEATAVPEPNLVAMLAGAAVMGVVYRRRKAGPLTAERAHLARRRGG